MSNELTIRFDLEEKQSFYGRLSNEIDKTIKNLYLFRIDPTDFQHPNSILPVPSDDYELQSNEKWIQILDAVDTLVFRNIMENKEIVQIEEVQIIGDCENIHSAMLFGISNSEGKTTFTTKLLTSNERLSTPIVPVEDADLLRLTGKLYILSSPVEFENFYTEKGNPEIMLLERHGLAKKFYLRIGGVLEKKPHQRERMYHPQIGLFLPDTASRSAYYDTVAKLGLEDLMLEVKSMTTNIEFYENDGREIPIE